MENAYKLAEVLLTDIDAHAEAFTSEEGKMIATSDSVMALNKILEKAFTLHKYLVEKELYVGKPSIEIALVELQKYMEKLQINQENAEKLNLSNALQLWNQAKIAAAILACNLLDFRDSLN